MNLTDLQDRLLGEWSGNNVLRLSWLTPSDFHSASTMTVARVAKGKFLSFAYTWSHENVAHEGFLLVGYDEKQKLATAAWVDSWHQSGKVLPLEGTIDEHGVISVKGFYEAPPGPDWGWRIVITPKSENEFQLVMINRPPEGEEDLAVQAEYMRVS